MMAMRSVWPKSIYDEHPYILSEKCTTKATEGSENTLGKMSAEVDLYNKNVSELEKEYNKYRSKECDLQSVIHSMKTTLIGLEYVIEHPPDRPNGELSYLCTLCSKNAQWNTIIIHLTCYWHRKIYLARHFPKAASILQQFSGEQYREGVGLIINRLARRVEAKFGRLKPISIEKEEYVKNKESIDRWILKGRHSTESNTCTFEEVVDINLIKSLNKSNEDFELEPVQRRELSPSHSIILTPAKPYINNFARSMEPRHRRTSQSSCNDEPTSPRHRDHSYKRRRERDDRTPKRSRDEPTRKVLNTKCQKRHSSSSYEYDLNLALEQINAAEESAKKTLAYHEKNPEEHPIYREEWKNFLFERYRKMLAEGKNPDKHDFKPEWKVYWSKRVKELHDKELMIVVNELYRKLRLTPPGTFAESKKSPQGRRSPDRRHRSRHSRRGSPGSRSRSPIPRRFTSNLGSSDPWRRSTSRRESPNQSSISPALQKKLGTNKEVMRFPWKSKAETKTRESSLDGKGKNKETKCQGLPPDREETTEPQDVSPENIIATLKLLVALEDYLGSIGPKIVDLLTEALTMEKEKTNLSEELLDRDIALVLIETAKEKLEGSLQVGLVASGAVAAVRKTVVRTAAMLQAADKRKKDKTKTVSVGEVDRSQIAQQMAAALIAHGKTDVSSEDLSQLVDAMKTVSVGEVDRSLIAEQMAAALIAQGKTDVASEELAQLVDTVKTGSIGEVDRSQIAQQMAAALIAQGKTDVSSEDLAQLVDAVVGITKEKKAVETRALIAKVMRPVPEVCVTHNSRTKKPENKAIIDVPGTVDSLSDSDFEVLLQNVTDLPIEAAIEEEDSGPLDNLADCDLEILLKNFSILPAEEQQCLIIYLQKLEASKPKRYNKLSQYANIAALRLQYSQE